MKSLKFLIIYSFISYSLTISINQIYYLKKNGKFEYDPSSQSFTIIDPSSFKGTSYIYLTYKSKDNSILEQDLPIHYFEKNTFNFNFEPSKVITGEIEMEKENESGYIYQKNFKIKNENEGLIIVQNLVSEGGMMELENKRNIPLVNQTGIIIVFTIPFAAILVGLIMLILIRRESTDKKIRINKKKIMKNRNIEMDFEDNNDIIIKAVKSANQKSAPSNESTDEDNDNNNGLNIIN